MLQDNERDKPIYTKDEVIEILRQVMFTGTPEFYDNNVILTPDHTTRRAKEAFNKYYLKKITA